MNSQPHRAHRTDSVCARNGEMAALYGRMSTRWISLLAFIVLCSVGLLSQEDPVAQKRFAGTWQAKFNGSVFLTIRLESGAGISGTVSAGRITVDDQGDLTEAEASPEGKESDVMHARIEGERLTFETDDDGELTKFEMRITGSGKAELRFVGQPVKIKPIRLDRV